jgi:hypothetical protein
MVLLCVARQSRVPALLFCSLVENSRGSKDPTLYNFRIQLANAESANAESANAESANAESSNAESSNVEYHPMPNHLMPNIIQCRII